jgi:hypothetical protein
MAITKMSNSGIASTGTEKYNDMLAGNPPFIPSDFESIATANGTGSSTTITFSSIPSTYIHLQIRMINYTGVGENVGVRFNNDTGSNYAYHQMFGEGASVGSSAVINNPNMLGGYSSASQYGSSVVDILDYKNTNKFKTIKSLHGSDANGSGFILFRSGLWQNTAAINRIDLFANNNFTAASQFALYGIKG